MEAIDYASQKVGEIVVNDYRAAEVFKSFGIDFCCGGKKMLVKACKEKNLDFEKVEQALHASGLQKQIPSMQEFNHWPLDQLVDYILETHHAYVNKNIPVLLEYTAKIARVHGDQHPELFEVRETFAAIAEELQFHMQREENILFPFIKEMVNKKEGETAFSAAIIAHPMRVMENDHEIVGKLMERVKQLTSSYVFPASACNSYRFTFGKLQEFEEDLHQHIHLENNILFKKVGEIE